MNIKEKLQQDLKTAQKEKDAPKVSVIRMILAELHNREIEKKGELDEDETLALLAREVKKRKESIEQFEKGGRADLSRAEAAEVSVIQAYMPEPMSERELGEAVRAAAAALGAAGPADFGKVMGAVMAKVKGRAAGEEVSRLVKKALDTAAN